MVNFIIIDHSVEGADCPQRVEISTADDSTNLFELMIIVSERLGLEPSSFNLVRDGEMLLVGNFKDGPSPTEIHLYRTPDDNVEVPVLTTYRGKTIYSVHAAGTTIREYQRFLARRFLVRPAQQLLYSMKILVYDVDKLAEFAGGGSVHIQLQKMHEMVRQDKVFISVKRRCQPGYITLVMNGGDTFDMLVGRLEREGEVREEEEVTFVSDGFIFDNWKTFGAYKLSHAKLHIME